MAPDRPMVEVAITSTGTSSGPRPESRSVAQVAAGQPRDAGEGDAGEHPGQAADQRRLVESGGGRASTTRVAATAPAATPSASHHRCDTPPGPTSGTAVSSGIAGRLRARWRPARRSSRCRARSPDRSRSWRPRRSAFGTYASCPTNSAMLPMTPASRAASSVVIRSRLSARPVASTAAPPANISSSAAMTARGNARDQAGQVSVGQLPAPGSSPRRPPPRPRRASPCRRAARPSGRPPAARPPAAVRDS